MKESYFYNKAESPQEKHLEYTDQRLFVPFIDVNYEKQQSVDVVLGESSKQIYLTAQWKPIINTHNILPLELYGEKGIDFKKVKNNTWKLLTNLSVGSEGVTKSHGNEDLPIINSVDRSLIPNVSILFNPGVVEGNNLQDESGNRKETVEAVFVKNVSGEGRGTIVVFGDIFKPAGMISLLHECGHAYNNTKSDSKKRKQLKQAAEIFYQSRLGLFDLLRTSKAADIVLEDERNAHAFALRILKDFVSAGVFSKETVLNLIHKDALQSYSDYGRGLQEVNLKKLGEALKKSLEDLYSKIID